MDIKNNNNKLSIKLNNMIEDVNYVINDILEIVYDKEYENIIKEIEKVKIDNNMLNSILIIFNDFEKTMIKEIDIGYEHYKKYENNQLYELIKNDNDIITGLLYYYKNTIIYGLINQIVN
jgi:hypothetical protein